MTGSPSAVVRIGAVEVVILFSKRNVGWYRLPSFRFFGRGEALEEGKPEIGSN
ncbi:MAG: hypothetical protein RIN56_00135 [Sporomusaceae bacterium]|nr:hypothetical protein [Sporomusaceae bacterium]